MAEPSRRHDPPSRPVDGAFTDQAFLRNLNSERVYCLANPDDFHTGVPEMLRLGWELETHRKDGPKFVGGLTAKDGDLMTYGGDVLLSRTKESQREYEAKKQSMADMRSKAIGQPGGVDGVRGTTGRPAQHTEDPREFSVRVG